MSVSSTMSVLSTVLSSDSKTITQSDVDNMSESELKDYLNRQDFLTKIKIAKKRYWTETFSIRFSFFS